MSATLPCLCQILAVVMTTAAVVLTVASLAGPDWVRAAYYEGKVQSWGLWWDCFKVHASFEMCVSAGIKQRASFLLSFFLYCR